MNFRPSSFFNRECQKVGMEPDVVITAPDDSLVTRRKFLREFYADCCISIFALLVIGIQPVAIAAASLIAFIIASATLFSKRME